MHKHLFEAIVEVLGDAVTAEVAAAWDELYWLMAQTLISMEDGLYADAGVAAGDVWRRVKVRERRNETADSVSFILTSASGVDLPSFAPGQYVSIGVHLPDGARQIRQYSLCSTPSTGEWQITVKRIEAQVSTDGSITPIGEVSNFLYDNVFEGDILDVTTPFGDVVLPEDDAPLLLISAGIGCTPVIGMLHHLAATGDDRPIVVLHADRSPSAHAHRAQLNELVAALPSAVMHRWYEDMGSREPSTEIRVGRVDIDDVPISPGTRVYLCGPLPFMRGIRTALSGERRARCPHPVRDIRTRQLVSDSRVTTPAYELVEAARSRTTTLYYPIAFATVSKTVDDSMASSECRDLGTMIRSPVEPSQDPSSAVRRTRPWTTWTVASPGFSCSSSRCPASSAIKVWRRTCSWPP